MPPRQQMLLASTFKNHAAVEIMQSEFGTKQTKKSIIVTIHVCITVYIFMFIQAMS